MKNTIKILDIVTKICFYLAIFFLPVFFLPITSDFFVLNKTLLLLVLTGTATALMLIKRILTKNFTLDKIAFQVPVLILVIAVIAASLIVSPNKIESLFSSNIALPFAVLTLLFFSGTSIFDKNESFNVFVPAMISAALLGIFVIYQSLDINQSFPGPSWLKDQFFTPAGSIFSLATYLLCIVVPSIVLIVRKIHKKKFITAVLPLVCSIFCAVGLAITAGQIIQNISGKLPVLPYRVSWSIALESIKQSPLFGTGIGNYLSAFNRFRPLSFNQSPYWNMRFIAGTSFPLQLMAEGGLILFAAYTLLAVLIVKTIIPLFRKFYEADEMKVVAASGLAVILVAQLLLPSNYLASYLLFYFLTLFAIRVKTEAGHNLSPIIGIAATAVFAVLFLAGSFFYGKNYLADAFFTSSIKAANAGDGKSTYDLQMKSISLNPSSPLYKRAFSQTNLALANSLATKKDLTDQDRQTISQLIQQAIAEAKNATAIDSLNAVNWENLAQIYRAIINFAQGADQWTLAAYQQSINLDPLNPRIRLDLGGLFYAFGNYNAAAIQFQNAANLKPDWANAYYNLAASLREQKDYQGAYQAMDIVLKLVPTNSDDYAKAKKEFDELELRVKPVETQEQAAQKTTFQEALTKPGPLPSPVITPPITLPTSAAPETPEANTENPFQTP